VSLLALQPEYHWADAQRQDKRYDRKKDVMFQCKVHGNYQEEQYIAPADIAVKKVNPPPMPNRKVSGEQYYQQENKQ